MQGWSHRPGTRVHLNPGAVWLKVCCGSLLLEKIVINEYIVINLHRGRSWSKEINKEKYGSLAIATAVKLTKHIFYSAFERCFRWLVFDNTRICRLFVVSFGGFQSAAHRKSAAPCVLPRRTVGVASCRESLAILFPVHRDVRWEKSRN